MSAPYDPSLCPHCGYDLKNARAVAVGDLSFDPLGDITWHGERVRMPPGQKIVLEALVRDAGRWVSRAVLHERLGYDGDHQMEAVLLSRIRRRLPGAPIENERGGRWRWAQTPEVIPA